MQYTLRFSHLAAALSLALFALVAFTPHQAHAAQVVITMTDDAFTPKNVTINAGDTVSFVNHGSMAHTATADNGSFDTGTINPGSTSTAVFSTPGTYSFYCKFHGGPGGQGMSGTITVVGTTASNTTTTGAYVNPNSTYYTGTAQTSAAVSTPQTAQLYAQVQALIAQISALQGQQGGTTAPTTTGSVAYNSSSCPLIGRALNFGASGDDVTRLQQFLARDTSIYPQGTVSGFYGALTQSAVQHWQVKYNIVSSGSPGTTGYGVVGPRTAAAIALLCTTGSYGGVSGPGGSSATPVGGFIQVTPISGNSPLPVSVTATVNTTLSCSGAQYTLDFGDGSTVQQIPVSAGNCSQVSQTYPHTYNYGGTYQIALSAGGHTTSASIVVSGPPAPAGTNGGTTPARPVGNISAFTTSGNAPFPVTFYVSCASGSAYNVVFGDGADLGGSGVSGSKCGSGGLDAVSHTYNSMGSFTAQLIVFSQQSNGTVVPTTLGSVGISVGSVATNYAYNPPVLSQGASALSFNLQFDLPTACTGYDLAWGDSSSHVIQGDGGSNCTQATTIKTISHTYATSSAYTITLKRGSSLSRSDDVAVTIQQ